MRLARATSQDQRFILAALGVTIIAPGDGTWELELEILRGPSADTPEAQIVNKNPGIGWGFEAISKTGLTGYQPVLY